MRLLCRLRNGPSSRRQWLIRAGAVRKYSRPKANKLIKWLRRILTLAVELGERHDNPALALGLKRNAGRTQAWAVEEVETVKEVAVQNSHRAVALTVQLCYDTSQRLSDILSAKWSQFDGEGLSFTQAKTGARVWVPLSDESLRMLSETPRTAVTIITSDITGRPFRSQTGVGKPFRKIRKLAGIREDLTIHDLRRTAATEAFSAGARAEPITGHRPGSNVLKTYEIPNKEAARRTQASRDSYRAKNKNLTD